MNDKSDFSPFKKLLPTIVYQIAEDILKARGQGIIVGGWLRDRLLQIPQTTESDIDIEVFGIPYEQLYHLCQTYGISACYPHFGVIRLKYVDLSLPRTEVLVGQKYNDFQIKIDPYLSFKQAACRRDFSVNAIGWNFLRNEVFDPFNGINAISEKCLIPLTEHFKEDSYRVLRAVQLIARLNLTPSPLLIKWSKEMNPSVISQQHINVTQEIIQEGKYKNAAIKFLKITGEEWENLLI